MWRSPDWARVPSLRGHVSWVWWQCCSTAIWRQDICQHSSEEQVKLLPLLGSHFQTQVSPHRKHIKQSRETSVSRSILAPLGCYFPAIWAGRSERTPGHALGPVSHQVQRRLSLCLRPTSPEGLEMSLWGHYSSFQPWVMHSRLQSPWETQHVGHSRCPRACAVSNDQIVIIDNIQLHDVLENQPVPLFTG